MCDFGISNMDAYSLGSDNAEFSSRLSLGAELIILGECRGHIVFHITRYQGGL